MKVYAFEWLECIYESSFFVESIHTTKRGAFKAMTKEANARCIAELSWCRARYGAPLKSKRWRVREIEVIGENMIYEGWESDKPLTEQPLFTHPAPATEPSTKVVPLSSMPELQSIVAKGLSDGTLQINGAAGQVNPRKSYGGTHADFASKIQVPNSEPNNNEVICPNCCTQFRAIPVDVQQLMLDAGFEPPFTAAPQSTAQKSGDAHEIWAAAQPTPGEGIEDGVARVEALLDAPRVPMTKDQIAENIYGIPYNRVTLQMMLDVRTVERFHGIGVKP